MQIELRRGALIKALLHGAHQRRRGPTGVSIDAQYRESQFEGHPVALSVRSFVDDRVLGVALLVLYGKAQSVLLLFKYDASILTFELRDRQHGVGRIARAKADVRAQGVAVIQRIRRVFPDTSAPVAQIQVRSGISPVEADPVFPAGLGLIPVFRIGDTQIQPAGGADVLVQVNFPRF